MTLLQLRAKDIFVNHFPDLPRCFCGGIAYYDGKMAADTVVFIHGAGLQAEFWTPQIRVLQNRRRVIAVDLLGHGKSALPSPPLTVESYGQPLLKLLQKLSLQKISLVGHSFGAIIAVDFALRHPQKVTRLAAFNLVFLRDKKAATAVQKRAAKITAVDIPPQKRTTTAVDISSQKRTVAAADISLKRWFGKTVRKKDQPAAVAVRKWLQTVDAKGYAAAYNLFAKSDRLFENRLRRLQMPSLFLTGEDDKNSAPRMSRRCAALAGDGECVIIGGGHLASLTNGAQCNKYLSAFLARAKK